MGKIATVLDTVEGGAVASHVAIATYIIMMSSKHG